MNRRLYIAGHAFLGISAVVIAAIGIQEITTGGLLAQGLIRIALALAVVGSQARSIHWDRREAAKRRTALAETNPKATP